MEKEQIKTIIDGYCSNSQFRLVQPSDDGIIHLEVGDIVIFAAQDNVYSFKGEFPRYSDSNWFQPIDGSKGFTVPKEISKTIKTKYVFRKVKPVYISVDVVSLNKTSVRMAVFSTEELYERIENMKGMIAYEIKTQGEYPKIFGVNKKRLKEIEKEFGLRNNKR